MLSSVEVSVGGKQHLFYFKNHPLNLGLLLKSLSMLNSERKMLDRSERCFLLNHGPIRHVPNFWIIVCYGFFVCCTSNEVSKSATKTQMGSDKGLQKNASKKLLMPML